MQASNKLFVAAILRIVQAFHDGKVGGNRLAHVLYLSSPLIVKGERFKAAEESCHLAFHRVADKIGFPL
jgi:hypothetical protein